MSYTPLESVHVLPWYKKFCLLNSFLHFPVSAGCFLANRQNEWIRMNQKHSCNSILCLSVKCIYIQSVPLPNEQGLRQVEVACSGSGRECLDIKCICSPDVKAKWNYSHTEQRETSQMWLQRVHVWTGFKGIQKHCNRNISNWQRFFFLSTVNW